MFHLFNDGVDGRASGNGLRLIRTYQLDVMAIPENDTVFVSIPGNFWKSVLLTIDDEMESPDEYRLISTRFVSGY